MNKNEIEVLIDELRALPKESEWVEFKVTEASHPINTSVIRQ